MRNKRRPNLLPFLFTAVVCLASSVLLHPSARADEKPASRWESAIVAFERQDQQKPPPQGAILFIGSSSIRFWDLPKSFPGMEVINRGFGGSELSDSVRFAPRLVIKHKPRLVVLYAGDNDIGAGKSPEQVVADFRSFVKIVHEGLPETKIIFLSIKPSTFRWKLWPKMREANALIEAFCKQQKQLGFVDVAKPMLDEGGQPRRELFRADGLHLNEKGYALWVSMLKPHLK
jgi:lysophospholipase L1-like esterase